MITFGGFRVGRVRGLRRRLQLEVGGCYTWSTCSLRFRKPLGVCATKYCPVPALSPYSSLDIRNHWAGWCDRTSLLLSPTSYRNCSLCRPAVWFPLLWQGMVPWGTSPLLCPCPAVIWKVLKLYLQRALREHCVKLADEIPACRATAPLSVCASTLPLLLSWAGYGYNACWVTDCLEQIRVTLNCDAELEQWGTLSARAINGCSFFVQARSVWWSHSWANIWTQIFTQFSISSARDKQIKEHSGVMERQPQRFACQRGSSPCKWNHQFFIKVQARCSICPNSTERAEKLELGFVYCHVPSAATFVQISLEDGGKTHPSLN